MADLNLLLALVGGLTLTLGLGAGVLRGRGYLPAEPMLATAFGVVLGPYGFAVVDLSASPDRLLVVEHLARVTVALAVTSIALRLPAPYVRERARSMATLLGPGMVAMWLVSATVVFVFLPVGIPLALLVGAAITPTDPVLANSIVVGTTAEESIPTRLRYLLSAEAGANDGGAYPFVFLAILLLAEPAGAALAEWVTGVVLWEVLGAILVGLAVGAAVGDAERRLRERGFVEETPVLTLSVALAATVLGLVALVGSDGLLAVFVAGVAFNWRADPRDEADEQRVSEVINRLFTIPVFVLLGAVLPLAEWVALGWRGLAVVVTVLAVRRLPMVLALRPAIEPLDRLAAALFVGWFGPIGIAAVFYAALAARETGVAVIWPVVTLVVAGSILAHGLTATPLTLRYGDLADEGEWW